MLPSIKKTRYEKNPKDILTELKETAIEASQIVRANSSGAFPAPKPEKRKFFNNRF